MTNRGEDFNGEHRQPDPQASSDPADASSGPDLGACPDADDPFACARAYAGANPCGPCANYTLMAGGIYGGAPMVMTHVPSAELDDAGISAGEIIGYRAWRMFRSDMLTSLYMENYTWTPGKIHKVDHALDQADGFYVFKDKAQLMAEFGGGRETGFSSVVFGTVALWGEVIEHERGYRAQYAAIKSFDKIEGVFFKRRALRKLRKNFGV